MLNGRIVKRKAEEFKEQAKLLGITHWDSHECHFCKYMTKYIFSGGLVLFDQGCDCLKQHNDYVVRSWDDIADYYNMQTSPDVIEKFDKFWGFK